MATIAQITAPTTINGGTLDINGTSNLSLRNEPIFVQGAGVGGNGAIINSVVSGGVFEAFHFVTMTGDTTFGGTSNGTVTDSGRWEIGRWTTGAVPVGYLNGGHFKLTKTGSDNVWLNNLGYVDLSALEVKQGELTIEWDNAFVGTVLVDAPPWPGDSCYTPITVDTGGVFSCGVVHPAALIRQVRSRHRTDP